MDESKTARNSSGSDDDSDQSIEVPTVVAEQTTAEGPATVTESETESATITNPNTTGTDTTITTGTDTTITTGTDTTITTGTAEKSVESIVPQQPQFMEQGSDFEFLMASPPGKSSCEWNEQGGEQVHNLKKGDLDEEERMETESLPNSNDDTVSSVPSDLEIGDGEVESTESGIGLSVSVQETESLPNNNDDTVSSVPSDLEIGDGEVEWTDSGIGLSVPVHGPGGEARSSTISGEAEEENRRLQDFEFEANDSEIFETFWHKLQKGETVQPEGQTSEAGTTIFGIPSNTLALGRNLASSSLLTLSPTLMLGEYHEDVIAGRQYRADTSRQLPFTGSFGMVRFAQMHSGDIVIALNTRIRVFNDRRQEYNDNGGIELNDQIQDISAHGDFVVVLLSTRAIIYNMVDGRLEYQNTVPLEASSGRVAVHGNVAYLVRERQHTIKRLDLTSYQITTFMSDMRRPGAIAVDMNGGRIFFADDHYVRIVDARGNALGHIHVASPVDDLVELNGVLYVLTLGGLRRYKYNADTDTWALQ